VKPVTSLSPTTVGIEPKSVCLQIEADARFAAGAGGVARYFADSCELEAEPAKQLQAAVVAACQEAFEYLSADHPKLSVAFIRHPDRIEVVLSYEGEPAPAVGLDAIVAGSAALSGVDRVQYETQGRLAITRLIKYIGRACEEGI
jgi:hypothetical protein